MEPEVEFNWWIEPENQPIRGNVLDSGDPEVDREQEEWTRSELAAGNDAAWCVALVEVTVIVDPDSISAIVFPGGSSVGGMSYESERQLWKDNLDDMKKEALETAIESMRAYAAQFPDQAALVLVSIDWLLENEGEILAPKGRR